MKSEKRLGKKFPESSHFPIITLLWLKDVICYGLTCAVNLLPIQAKAHYVRKSTKELLAANLCLNLDKISISRYLGLILVCKIRYFGIQNGILVSKSWYPNGDGGIDVYFIPQGQIGYSIFRLPPFQHNKWQKLNIWIQQMA